MYITPSFVPGKGARTSYSYWWGISTNSYA